MVICSKAKSEADPIIFDGGGVQTLLSIIILGNCFTAGASCFQLVISTSRHRRISKSRCLCKCGTALRAEPTIRGKSKKNTNNY